jgi:hypothetical protein
VNGIVLQEEHSNTGPPDTALDKLKQQVNIFKNDVANSFMPWILDVPRNSELDEYNKVIPELASKVQKMKAVRNIHFLQPTVNLSVLLLFHHSSTTFSIKCTNLFQICEDADKIPTALEILSNIKFEEPSIDESFSLPHIQKD